MLAEPKEHGNLVLTRKEFESVVLIDDATNELIAKVQIVMTSDKRVRLSITAPQSVRIMREELLKEADDETAN